MKVFPTSDEGMKTIQFCLVEGTKKLTEKQVPKNSLIVKLMTLFQCQNKYHERALISRYAREVPVHMTDVASCDNKRILFINSALHQGVPKLIIT